MMRLHLRLFAALIAGLLVSELCGGEEKWAEDSPVSISPAAAVLPAMKYRLFPMDPDLKPGDAAPIYLRFAHERSDQTKRDLQEKPAQWNDLPLDKLPRDEVKAFLHGHAYNLKQLDLGARRQTCNWHYTLDAGDVFRIHLGDAHEMRMYASLLRLKARLEVAEGDYPAALRTLETGFGFSRHLAEGSTIIHGLIGIATATQFLRVVQELAQQPDAPNLYWALASLPRPLVDLRKAMEVDQRAVLMQFPELADLNRERSPEQWEAVLKRMRTEVTLLATGEDAKKVGPVDPEKELAAAKKYLTQRGGVTEAAVKVMPPAQTLLLALAGQYREICDDAFKGTYLPYPEGRAASDAARARLDEAPDTEVTRFARLFLPGIAKVQAAQARMERKVAALRLVEALRMHAAANGGKLPDRLEEVKAAPVPTDPATARPFEYQRDGQSATISSRLPGEPLERGGLRLRVTVRK